MKEIIEFLKLSVEFNYDYTDKSITLQKQHNNSRSTENYLNIVTKNYTRIPILDFLRNKIDKIREYHVTGNIPLPLSSKILRNCL